MNKTEILTQALEARKEELLGYQINIDNYRLAIAKIVLEHDSDSDMDVAMRKYAEHIENLLKTSLVEQRKAQVMHDVIASQL